MHSVLEIWVLLGSKTTEVNDFITKNVFGSGLPHDISFFLFVKFGKRFFLYFRLGFSLPHHNRTLQSNVAYWKEYFFDEQFG
ncbi:MAG: hypothetical protein HY22_06125 [[Candidatus Thermochlorobacteriaceae] bacterium GBChlB]|nr:MAG: hypothetical protein HY22_06125 [[Candidatus Thermochlorobacteriaceae] bacterium GBChlB]